MYVCVGFVFIKEFRSVGESLVDLLLHKYLMRGFIEPFFL